MIGSSDHRLWNAIEEVGRAHFGDLDRSELGRAVARVSASYTTHRQNLADLEGDGLALAARLHFFLPRDLPKIEPILRELGRAGLLPRRRTWRILDLGAGLGTTTLGVARFAARTGAADRLQVLAVDRDRRALDLFRDLAARAESAGLAPIELRVRTDDLQHGAPDRIGGEHDLVVAGLVLNELVRAGSAEDARAQSERLAHTLTGWAHGLAPDGVLIALEPALRETARRLQAARDRLVERGGPLHVASPCLRCGPCPMLEAPRDWCHTDLPGDLPAPVAELARSAGLRSERRTFCHLALRRAPGTAAALVRPGTTAYRVVSAPLRTKGKVERVLCGEAGLARLMRLDRHAGPDQQPVEGLPRGALIALEGAPRQGRWRLPPDGVVDAPIPDEYA